MAYTVTQLRAMYIAQIAPGQPSEFLRLLQEAEIKLLESGRWAWCKARVSLTPVNGIVTLPSQYAAIIGAQVEGAAISLKVEDHEFYPDGEGDVEVEGGYTKLIDQGFADDVRTYKLAGADSSDTLSCLVHKAPATLYDPAIADSSLPEDITEDVTCPDASALKLCMLSIIMEEAHDNGAARDYLASCYARLNDREKTRRGNAQATPSVRPNGRGVRPIRNLR
jgi:hypothetical protein